MKKLPFKTFLFIISVSLLTVSCSDVGTGIEESGSVTFQGEVEGTSQPNKTSQSYKTSEDVEGAVVTAARVTASGNLEAISNAETQTNAQGEYTLTVDLSAVNNAANHIVIVAETSGQSAKAFVAADIEGGTIPVQPITFESSGEAEVYQHVVGSGNANATTKANIEATVGVSVATEIENNTQAAADVAASLVAAAQARTAFYAEQGVEVTQDQYNKIVQLKQQAMVQLAAQLNSTESAEAEEAAFKTFLQTVANAQLEAGVEAWAAAEANDLSARVLVHESSELSAEAQAELRKYAYYFTAGTLEEAVKAKAKAIGASDATINAITEASAELQASILTAQTASADKIDAFFTDFNSAVQAAIASDASLKGNAYIAANTAISEATGLKSTFETALNATSNLKVMLKAYSAFYSGVNTLVETTFTGLSSAEAKAYTRLLVLTNLST